MSSKQINQLPSGVANSEAVVAADNANLTVTEKIKLGDIASLANDASKLTIGTLGDDRLSENIVRTTDSRLSDMRDPKPHLHDDRYYTEIETDKIVRSPWWQLGADIVGGVGGAWSGYSVCLSGDGRVLVVGAPTDGTVNTTASGSVKVYAWNSNSWNQIGTNINGDYVGTNVATNHSGEIVAVSGVDATTFAGYVRVYSWNGTNWVQVGGDIIDATPGDQSIAISLNSAGTVLAVGGRYNSASQQFAGHVRVFYLNDGAWEQQGTDIEGSSANDFFGQSVSLNSSGSTLAVGAVSPISFGGQGAGYASVYLWNGTAWLKLGNNIVGEANDDHSGVSVSISNDGDTVAVGAHWNDAAGTDAGHVRVHSWNGSSWIQKGTDIDGESPDDWSGYSVSLSGDGNTVAIGTPTTSQTGSGRVSAYKWSGEGWHLSGQKIFGYSGSNSGWSVSLSDDGNVLAVGGIFADINNTDDGLVRVFRSASVSTMSNAANIYYDNSDSGLVANNVKSAIDYIAEGKAEASHTHEMSDLSNISIQPSGSPPVPYDIALTYKYSTGEWVARTVGNVGVGSRPLTGWAAGSVGDRIDQKVTNAGNVSSIRRLTQAEYDAIEAPDENTLYIILG